MSKEGFTFSVFDSGDEVCFREGRDAFMNSDTAAEAGQLHN